MPDSAETPPTNREQSATGKRAHRRNERGLTTLEWLLIVAAVAGLAALAVVLVQNVVDDTAEQISGSNARLIAANVAAQEISDSVDSSSSESEKNAAEAKCNRLKITYASAFSEANMTAKWDGAHTCTIAAP